MESTIMPSHCAPVDTLVPGRNKHTDATGTQLHELHIYRLHECNARRGRRTRRGPYRTDLVEAVGHGDHKWGVLHRGQLLRKLEHRVLRQHDIHQRDASSDGLDVLDVQESLE